MNKFFYFTLLALFYLSTVGCLRTEGQQKTTDSPIPGPVKNESTVQDESVAKDEGPAKNESTAQKEVKSEKPASPVATLAATKEQKRIVELVKEVGLQGVRMEKPFSADFSLPDLNDQTHKLSSYKGKVIFLNFWATWCGPCRLEMPDMQKLYDNFKDKNFEMLAVNLQERKTIVGTFLKDNGYTFPVLLDTNGSVGRNYGTASIPITLLFNKAGYAIYGAIGSREWSSPAAMELISLLIDMP